jgi:hypothetical protein
MLLVHERQLYRTDTVVPQLRRLEFEPGSGHVGVMVEEVALGSGFLLVLPFPLPVIPHTAPDSPSSMWLTYQVDSVSPHLINNKTNFVALVRERTMPIERPPLVGEVSVNF